MANKPWKKAIEEVLMQSDRPMSRTEIAEAIVAKGLRTDVGKTPANTVVSNISTSIKNDGKKSPFIRLGRGEYWIKKLFESQSQQSSEMDDNKFEEDDTNLINAFGMFWERSKIDWSQTKPSLRGVEQPGAEPIDFSSQIGVYILYDSHRPIYVGRTTSDRIGQRLREHHTISRFSGRWDRFSWFGICPIDEKGKLLSPTIPGKFEVVVTAMEALLIEAMEPVQNRKRGDGFSGVEYLQVDDPKLEAQSLERLIHEKLFQKPK